MRQFFLRDYVKNFIRIFFLGIIVGIVVIFLCKGNIQTNSSILNEEWILKMQSEQINSKALFVYVLLERFKEIGVLFLISSTMIGCVCLYGYAALIGAGGGIFLAIACLRYGAKGIVMVFVAAFPQILVYLPLFLYVFHIGYQFCVRLYYPQKDYWKNNQSNRVFFLTIILHICVVLVVLFVGILLESYVNPKIFFSYLKNF